MEVEKKKAITYDFQDKRYYFCSPSCKSTFEKDSGKYAKATVSGTSHESHEQSGMRHDGGGHGCC